MKLEGYKHQVYEDAIEYIDEIDLDNYFNDFYDLFNEIELVVTGNDNGSYYCNRYDAEESVKDLVFDDYFNTILDWYDLKDAFYSKISQNNPEGADVIARIAILWTLRDDIWRYWKEKIDG